MEAPSHHAYMLTYVLELENGNYYVGRTMSLNVRLAYHWMGEGARWTKLYKPVRLLHVFVGDKEREKTLMMMRIHGWQNVRGSSWCRVDMKKAPACLQV